MNRKDAEERFLAPRLFGESSIPAVSALFFWNFILFSHHRVIVDMHDLRFKLNRRPTLFLESSREADITLSPDLNFVKIHAKPLNNWWRLRSACRKGSGDLRTTCFCRSIHVSDHVSENLIDLSLRS